jgi:sulfite reductase (ferredoxin)
MSGKPSAVEEVKRASRGLRGRLAEGLVDGSPNFDDEGYNLLKFHGVYQGYDRDTATERKQQGLEKDHRFMVRARIPGGRLTAAQYLALDALADRYGNGTLRVTTRQSIQFHGVIKSNLKQQIAAMNAALVSTIAACGDVVRNVTTVPAPIRDAVHARLEADAKALSKHLSPATRGYYEIWLDEEKIVGEEPEDPIYGAAYLPRKFKIGLATTSDNSVDVLTNDLGIIAVFEGDRLVGYQFALGGSLGMTHNNPKTYPRVATPVAWVEPDDLIPAAAAVVRLHREEGDRSNRRHARLKYVIAEKGEEWARERLSEYLGKELEKPRVLPRLEVVDHLGWHEQGDGKLYLGVPIPSGRIVDTPTHRLRTALRTVIERFGSDPVMMPSQDIILSNIAPRDRHAVEALLRQHGVVLGEDLRPVQRWALACPALPTCGLALTEAERVREPMVAAIEERLLRHGLGNERLSVRITGCPNGCARPYVGDIGIVGRMPGHYALFVGGDFAGTRLNFLLLDRIPEPDVPDVLDKLFALFATDREDGEGFGDWCHRLGRDALLEIVGVPARKAS